jgi:phospholipid/cholesterol/gamma-HCH transport system permease protein
VGVVYLGLDGGTYVTALENSVDFTDDVLQSFVKASVFGILLGIIGTYRGFTSERNAAGVSRATTSTVVTTSVWILVSDYFITALWGV